MTRLKTKTIEDLHSLGLLAGTFAACLLIKQIFLQGQRIDSFSAYYVASLLLCALFFSVRYQSETRALGAILKGIVLMLGFYSTFNYPSWVSDQAVSSDIHTLIRFSAAGLSILVIWRPAFAIPVICYTVWRKKLDYVETGLFLSPTDYMPIVEVGLFLCMGIVLPQIVARYVKLSRSTKENAALWILVAAIGIHFSNYFYSGVAKLLLNGGPLSWVMDNPTYALMLNAWEAGLLPIGHFENLSAWIYEWFRENVLFFNMLTLIGQLLCLVLVTRPRHIITITVFYDIMHIMIFFLTGIFFWKWIILNLLIVFAFSRITSQRFDWKTISVAVGTIVSAPLGFFVAWLAWYDSPGFNHIYLEANTQAGQTFRVPTNYYLNASVPMVQGRILGHLPGHFRGLNTLGSHESHQIIQAMQKCEAPLSSGSESVNFGPVERFIRGHDAFIRGHANEQGRVYYDRFPHHIWSNPLLYKEFSQIDKRTISSYQIVVESKCVSLINGKVSKHTVTENRSAPIAVP